MKNSSNDTANNIPELDANSYKMHLSDFLREPVIRSAIQALRLPPGSSGLDAGCGIGSHTLLLAEAVGIPGHVTGLDLFTERLDHAREIIKRFDLSAQISFNEGDISNLPFGNNTFDWLWSSDCAGYSTKLPVKLIEELIRVVKPGGIIAILAWSSQQLLPGYPLLEARLNTTSSSIAPFIKGMSPEKHFLRTPGWFRNAGLQEITAQTFAGNIQAPLSDNIRNAMISLFEMRWGEVRSELTVEDWTEYQRLCQPESPDFILNLPDYYAFFTYTMFHGKVTK